MLNRKALEQLRRAIIMLLDALDDILGYPRTIPNKTERRNERQLKRLSNH